MTSVMISMEFTGPPVRLIPTKRCLLAVTPAMRQTSYMVVIFDRLRMISPFGYVDPMSASDVYRRTNDRTLGRSLIMNTPLASTRLVGKVTIQSSFPRSSLSRSSSIRSDRVPAIMPSLSMSK
ncbi:hypothetical protein D3C73_1316700 [compost metagenome]